jgi:hypothetical protein
MWELEKAVVDDTITNCESRHITILGLLIQASVMRVSKAMKNPERGDEKKNRREKIQQL